MSYSQKKRIDFSAFILAMIIIISGTTYYFVQAQDKTVFVKKQMELRNLATTTFEYYLFEDSAPKNPNRSGKWCEVDKYYGKKRCLSELERDGYLVALPISPDEGAYYYKFENGNIYVGTPIPKDYILKSENSCIGNTGEPIWCYIVK